MNNNRISSATQTSKTPRRRRIGARSRPLRCEQLENRCLMHGMPWSDGYDKFTSEPIVDSASSAPFWSNENSEGSAGGEHDCSRAAGHNFARKMSVETDAEGEDGPRFPVNGFPRGNDSFTQPGNSFTQPGGDRSPAFDRVDPKLSVRPDAKPVSTIEDRPGPKLDAVTPGFRPTLPVDRIPDAKPAPIETAPSGNASSANPLGSSINKLPTASASSSFGNVLDLLRGSLGNPSGSSLESNNALASGALANTNISGGATRATLNTRPSLPGSDIAAPNALSLTNNTGSSPLGSDRSALVSSSTLASQTSTTSVNNRNFGDTTSSSRSRTAELTSSNLSRETSHPTESDSGQSSGLLGELRAHIERLAQERAAQHAGQRSNEASPARGIDEGQSTAASRYRAKSLDSSGMLELAIDRRRNQLPTESAPTTEQQANHLAAHDVAFKAIGLYREFDLLVDSPNSAAQLERFAVSAVNSPRQAPLTTTLSSAPAATAAEESPISDRLLLPLSVLALGGILLQVERFSESLRRQWKRRYRH